MEEWQVLQDCRWLLSHKQARTTKLPSSVEEKLDEAGEGLRGLGRREER